MAWRRVAFIARTHTDTILPHSQHNTTHTPFFLRARAQTKEAVAKEMQGATFCISEAVWAAGDFRKHVVDAPQKERALATVRVRRDNVAGVRLPVFALTKGTGSTVEMETLGLASGGRQIAAAKEKFTSLLELLVKLGSLQTSFLTLDEAIKVTNRRVNALDNVRGARPSLALNWWGDAHPLTPLPFLLSPTHLHRL